jgi:PAS domain S-box-containing protein
MSSVVPLRAGHGPIHPTALREAFFAAGVGLCLLDPQGRVLLANEEWLRSAGLTAAAALGRDIWELFPNSPPELRRLHDAARAGATQSVAAHRQEVGGREVWYQGQLTPVTLEEGVGLLITAFDITAARTAAQRERSEEMRALLDSVPAAVWIAHDAGATCIQHNRFALHLLRVPLERNPSLTAPQEERPTWFRVTRNGMEIPAAELPVQLAASTGSEVHGCEFDIEFQDGQTRRLFGNAKPLFDELGHSCGAVGAFIDITERRQAETALRESEALYRSLFNLVPVGVLVTDANGRIYGFNDQAHESLGYTRAEFGALGASDLEADQESFGRRTREVLVSGECEYDTRFRTRAGELRDVRVRSRLTELDGKKRILSSWLDVTEQTRAMSALKESTTLLRAISDTIPDPLFIKDLAGRIIFANPATLAAVGKPAEQILGHTESEFLDDQDEAEQIRRNDRAVMDAGQVLVVEEWVNTPGGARLFLGTKAPRRDEQGNVIGLVGMSRDITERKRAADALQLSEARLREANAALARGDRRKDEFLATLSHELRNPLAPIRSAANVLASGRCDAGKVQWAASLIERQVKHMSSLLDDLLDVARVTQGKLTLRLEHTSLGSIIDTAVESARPLIETKRHTLRVSIPQDVRVIHCDPVRMSQVVSNLLINAAKYTDPDGHITLDARFAGEALTIRVTDDGIGIPRESLEEIFTMFSQASDETRSEGGLGIGLALVRGLIAMHGGTIEAHSAGEGKGSEFVVSIPWRSPALEPHSAETHNAARVQRAGRILIADDNRDAAESLALLLGTEGYEVRTAFDGEEAIRLAEEFRPDTALIDIGMPRLDGYEVARRLRTGTFGANLTLVALTGWGGDSDRQRTAEAGFDAHVTKPIKLEQLMALLRSA